MTVRMQKAANSEFDGFEIQPLEKAYSLQMK